jgi:hypothetical protein
MLIFDRVTAEDRVDPSSPSAAPGPCASDAIDLFHDLCVLTAGQIPKGFGGLLGGSREQRKARMLKLGSVARTFGFELIESVLGGFEEGVKRVSPVIQVGSYRLTSCFVRLQHAKLLELLKHDLCPLLLRTLHAHPTFPVTLRLMRLIFLLLRSFADQLTAEAEVFFMILVKLAAGDADALSDETMRVVPEGGEMEELEGVKPHVGKGKDGNHPPPHWLKVLALEILRG